VQGERGYDHKGVPWRLTIDDIEDYNVDCVKLIVSTSSTNISVRRMLCIIPLSTYNLTIASYAAP
jgi:hypothetical protein